MKVRNISSFFSQPGSSRAGSEASDQAVEVPTRPKKGGSKKPTKADKLKVHIENSDEESDREDPLPRKARKQTEGGSGKGNSKSRKPPVVPEDSDDSDKDKEDPLPKSMRQDSSSRSRAAGENQQKSSHEKKRKARALSDSDDDDFKTESKTSTVKPASKLAKTEKPSQIKKKEEVKVVNPADFFGSAPAKREVKEKKVPVQTVKQDSSPEKRVTRSSPRKAAETQPVSTRPKPNEFNNDRGSPLKPQTLEPKKVKMETLTPEKTEKLPNTRPSKPKSPDKGTQETKLKLETSPLKLNLPPEKKKDPKGSPEKSKVEIKMPSPATANKSKTSTGTASSSALKRPIEEDEDEEEDFNPKKRVATPSKTSTTKVKSEASKRRDKTPAMDDTDKAPKPISDLQKENFKKFLAKAGMKPKNLGSKDIPTGAPNCLQGLTFVMSGVLDSLERDDCKDLITKYGGRVTGSVSKKTSYLIVGDEPGESKIKKALQLNVPQIDEDALLDMIRKSNPNGQSQDSGLAYSEYLAVDSDQEHDLHAEESKVKSPSKKKVDAGAASVKKEVHSPSSSKSKVPQTSVATLTPQSSAPADSDLMWVDKYKPKTLKSVVGQGTESSNAKKLVRWLQNWFKHHGSSQDKVKAAWPGLKDPDGKTFKAALLSGPPGIGKTTSAHLAVKEVGYDYFELNASDTRNKKGLHQNVADAVTSKSLVFGRTQEEMTRRHVLIMDEVDGMSGNEDRGGVQELIALIKSSRVPVICICNDRNHTKIRSLSNYCYDLRFNKPSFEQLKAFVMSICFKEKLKIPQEKIRQLIVSTDNDVRQILHQLELYQEGQSEQAYNPRKDLRFGPWDVVRKVFHKSEHDKMNIHDKTGLFFQDYNIGPLFVQENYLRWAPAAAGGNRYKHMDLLRNTSASIADGDLVETVIRRSQNWSLLPVQAVFSSFMPGEYMASNNTASVDFPAWLGKNSNKNKRQRLLQSLHSHLHLHVSGSLEALNMDYLPYLRRTITKPLTRGDHEDAAKVMEDYTLLRDDVETINDLSLWPGCSNPMEQVETRVKSAFTRLVNKEILPYSNAQPVKGRGRGGGGTAEDNLEELLEEAEEGGVAVVEEEEDDSPEKDAMVKVKTRKTKAASSKTSAGTSKNAGQSKKKAKKIVSDSDDDISDYDDHGKNSKGSKKSKASSSKSRKGN